MESTGAELNNDDSAREAAARIAELEDVSIYNAAIDVLETGEFAPMTPELIARLIA